MIQLCILKKRFYDETIKQDIDKSIELLIKSSTEFKHAFNLLCVVLIKTFGFDIEKIKNEIDKRVGKSNELYSKIIAMVNLLIYSGESIVNYLYEEYRNKDFLYDVLFDYICTSDLLKENTEQKEKNPHLKDISEDFYEGFGYDLIRRNSNS